MATGGVSIIYNIYYIHMNVGSTWNTGGLFINNMAQYLNIFVESQKCTEGI